MSAAALNETFTSPDGALSFHYPTGWTVALATDTKFGNRTAHKSWTLNDASGQTMLTLEIRAGVAMIGSAPLTPILRQGHVEGMAGGPQEPTQAVVAGSPGQALGANGVLMYGMHPGTGGSTNDFQLPWGENHLLSFHGSRDLGPNDQIDLEAEAEEFAASAQFREQLLPIIESLVALNPPPAGETSIGNAGETACVGAKYTYQNLGGITCDEAKTVLQTVMETGRPHGARSQIAEDIECYAASSVERATGLPLMTCWVLDHLSGDRGKVLLEAHAR